MEEIKPAETTALPNTASRADEVKTIEQPQVDYLAELKARDEKIAKLQSERDNYRVGMLKYKKQKNAETEERPEVTDEERFRQIAREELMNSELARASAEKEELVKKMAKELSEAKVAMANKSQISHMPGGASQPQDTFTVEKLTAEQKTELENQAKAIGVDPKKHIEGFLRNWEKEKNK